MMKEELEMYSWPASIQSKAVKERHGDSLLMALNVSLP